MNSHKINLIFIISILLITSGCNAPSKPGPVEQYVKNNLPAKFAIDYLNTFSWSETGIGNINYSCHFNEKGVQVEGFFEKGLRPYNTLYFKVWDSYGMVTVAQSSFIKDKYCTSYYMASTKKKLIHALVSLGIKQK